MKIAKSSSSIKVKQYAKIVKFRMDKKWSEGTWTTTGGNRDLNKTKRFMFFNDSVLIMRYSVSECKWMWINSPIKCETIWKLKSEEEREEKNI